MTEMGDLEAKLGHRFLDPGLLEQALTHGSVRHEQQTSDGANALAAIPDNERLEFLGDAIVGMIVAELLYRRYPELHEGELTRLRAALVSRKHLGMVGTSLDLGSYLHLGRAEERNGGRGKAVLLANCMEALIGALYLEGGLKAAAAFVERTVAQPYLERLRGDLRENRAIGDFKTALQELLQSRRTGQPEYVVQAESGPDHRKRFLVEVRVNSGKEEDKAQAEGSTKKKAEQEAARLLYQQITGRGPVGERRPEAPADTIIVPPAQAAGTPEGPAAKNGSAPATPKRRRAPKAAPSAGKGAASALRSARVSSGSQGVSGESTLRLHAGAAETNRR